MKPDEVKFRVGDVVLMRGVPDELVPDIEHVITSVGVIDPNCPFCESACREYASDDDKGLPECQLFLMADADSEEYPTNTDSTEEADEKAKMTEDLKAGTFKWETVMDQKPGLNIANEQIKDFYKAIDENKIKLPSFSDIKEDMLKAFDQVAGLPPVKWGQGIFGTLGTKQSAKEVWDDNFKKAFKAGMKQFGHMMPMANPFKGLPIAPNTDAMFSPPLPPFQVDPPRAPLPTDKPTGMVCDYGLGFRCQCLHLHVFDVSQQNVYNWECPKCLNEWKVFLLSAEHKGQMKFSSRQCKMTDKPISVV